LRKQTRQQAGQHAGPPVVDITFVNTIK
jgi:hypothetical protein